MKWFTPNQLRKSNTWYTSHPKPPQIQWLKHCSCCLRWGCLLPVFMASPQLGSFSISSWLKSVVAPSGLTRHKTGNGSCNREIIDKVVLGILLFPCIQYQLANLSSLLRYIPPLRPRSAEYSVVDDNMWYLVPIRQWITFHHAPIYYNTYAYNITSILLVLERTISRKLIIRALVSDHSHNSTINSSTGSMNTERRDVLLHSPDSIVLNSVWSCSLCRTRSNCYCCTYSVKKYLDAALM